MYTYPIDQNKSKEYKICLIKEIFQQLKFISRKLTPLPIWLIVQINSAKRVNGEKLWYGDIFDALYDAETSSLEIVNRNLHTQVEAKAKDRLKERV